VIKRNWNVSQEHSEAAEGCLAIANSVGMSFVEGSGGWDDEIVKLAEQCFFDKSDIRQRPLRVAREITRMLDDMVKNP